MAYVAAAFVSLVMCNVLVPQVRGFNDRAAPALQDGSPPFKQPFNGRLHAIDKHLLPFHLSFNKSAATCMPAPEMAYPSDVGIINGGW